MTVAQQMITIAILVVGTMLTRFLPFLIFRESRPTPKYVQYLGKALPAASFGMLVVYCLKPVSFLAHPFGLPEFLGIAATVLVHLWKRQLLLSVSCGTIVYMLLVQLVF